jgi:hypothetical protein
MREGSTTSAVTDSTGRSENTATVRRSYQHTRENEKNDPVAYWYAEALSRR